MLLRLLPLLCLLFLSQASRAQQSGTAKQRQSPNSSSVRSPSDNYYDKKQYDHAIQDYDQAIRVNPNYATTFNWGYAYYDKKDYERAIHDYDQAIRPNRN